MRTLRAYKRVRCACARATPTQSARKFCQRNSRFVPKRESFSFEGFPLYTCSWSLPSIRKFGSTFYNIIGIAMVVLPYIIGTMGKLKFIFHIPLNLT